MCFPRFNCYGLWLTGRKTPSYYYYCGVCVCYKCVPLKVWTLPRIKVKKNSKRYNYNSTFSSLSVVLTYSYAHTPSWITVSSGSLTCIWSTMGVFFFFCFSFFLSCVLLINHSINSFCFMSVHIEVILDPKRTHILFILIFPQDYEQLIWQLLVISSVLYKISLMLL